MRDKDAFEHRSLIEVLLPNDSAEAVVAGGGVAFHTRAIERFRAVAEQRGVLAQKGFYFAVRFLQFWAFVQRTAARNDLPGRAGDFVEVHGGGGDAVFQLGSGGAAFRGWFRPLAFIEIRQRLTKRWVKGKRVQSYDGAEDDKVPLMRAENLQL